MLNSEKVWDPAEGELAVSEVQRRGESFRKRVAELRQGGEKALRGRRNKVLTICVLCFLGAIIALYFTSSSLATLFFCVGFVPVASFYARLADETKDLAKLLLAEKKGWLYVAERSEERWQKFLAVFPDFFNKGNENRTIQDEFWGEFEAENKSYAFWSGIFDYQIKTRDSKGRTQTQDFKENVFVLRLPKSLKVDFRLVPEGIGQKFLNWFRSKEVQTESVEFNKTFAFYYDGEKKDNELEIVKTLSPAVQLQLLNLKKKRGEVAVWFRKDCAVFVFNNDILKNVKTDLLKKIEVADEDLRGVNDYIKDVLGIVSGILKYLD